MLAPLRDGEELLGEEGIAAAAVVEPRDEGAIGRTAEDARQLVVDFAARERRELEAIHLPAAPQLGEQGQERMALVQLVGAVRPDQHHAALGEVSYQEAEQVAGRPIRPVKVLQRDDGDCIGGDALDQSEHLEVERGLRRRRSGRRPTPRLRRRTPGRESAAGRRIAPARRCGRSPPAAVTSATDGGRRRRGRTGARRLPGRRIRLPGRAVRRTRRPRGTPRADGSCRRPPRRRRATVPTAPGHRAFEHGPQPLKLLAAPDEHGARDPRGHPRIIRRLASAPASTHEAGLRNSAAGN